MRKTLISLAAGLSMLALPAFAASVVDVSQACKDISAGKTVSIATVVKVDCIAWFDRMRDAVKQFGEHTGHDVWQIGPSQGVDAICVVPFSVEAVEPVLQKARDRGIVVIAHEASNLKNPDYVLEAFDNQAYGAKLMEVLGKSLGDKDKYLATVGGLTLRRRTSGSTAPSPTRSNTSRHDARHRAPRDL